MKKALIIALGAGTALVLSGLSIAKTESNTFQTQVVSAQSQDVAQKHKSKTKKSKKKMKTGSHHQQHSGKTSK